MKKLHLICNAHIDPIWQWTWDEGIATALSTFQSAANLADEYDYVFCHNESLLYEAVEKYAPVLFGRICELIKKGKWVISGGWYLQPDCNMPSGESLVRQIAIGHEYFYKKFGVVPNVATNYDSFGHSIGLVQILAKSGYVGYLHCRPSKPREIEQFDYPSRFYRWVAPSGDRVICAHTFSYGSVMGEIENKIREELAVCGDVDYVLWGVGNHGGGPSRADLKTLQNLKIDGVEYLHSTPDRLMADDVHVGGEVKMSLNPTMPGCYSSMSRIKKAHRETESLFYATEKMLAVATLGGYEVDTQNMDTALKQLLLSQFHDILPGTCTQSGEEEGLELLAAARHVCKDQRTGAFLHAVMGQPIAKEGEYPVFVYNFMPYEVTRPVEVELMAAAQNWDLGTFLQATVCDEQGNQIDCQQIKEDSTIHIDWRKRIAFVGKLKPLSVTRFSIRLNKIQREKVWETPAQTGLLDALKGKVLTSPVKLVCYNDTSDAWAMSDEELHAVGCNPVDFRPMTAQEIQEFCNVKGELSAEHVIENGDVLTAVEQFVTTGKTNAVIEYRAWKNLPFVDLKVTVEYADPHKLIRLHIPSPTGQTVGDGPYVIEDKNNGEIVFQKWVGKREKGGVFAVINDGVYGAKNAENEICLTLLRGAGYLIHPMPFEPQFPQDRYMPTIECGRYVYRFRIITGSLTDVCCEAELFHQPPYAVNVFPLGTGVNEASVFTDKPVVMTAFKQSANGGYVLRFFNPEIHPVSFTLSVQGVLSTVTMGASQIVSVVYRDGAIEVIDKSLPV